MNEGQTDLAFLAMVAGCLAFPLLLVAALALPLGDEVAVLMLGMVAVAERRA
jgi:hypothetical protein